MTFPLYEGTPLFDGTVEESNRRLNEDCLEATSASDGAEAGAAMAAEVVVAPMSKERVMNVNCKPRRTTIIVPALYP